MEHDIPSFPIILQSHIYNVYDVYDACIYIYTISNISKCVIWMYRNILTWYSSCLNDFCLPYNAVHDMCSIQTK